MGQGWHQLPLEHFNSLISSTGTVQIPQNEWLPFLDRMPGAIEMWSCSYSDVINVTSDGTTIPDVVGHFDAIRRDSDHPVYKAYRYLLCRHNDKSVWFVGPFKELDYGHWLPELPSWRST